MGVSFGASFFQEVCDPLKFLFPKDFSLAFLTQGRRLFVIL
jgi:hypothetical protein